MTRKEKLYRKLVDQQKTINDAFTEKDQQFYGGPTCLFLFGGFVGLLFGGLLIALLVVIVSLVWAILRSGDKRSAESRYDAAVRRGQELRDEYDDCEEA